MSELREYIEEQIAKRPREDFLVRVIYQRCLNACDPIVEVQSDGYKEPVSTLEDVQNEVFNLDEAFLVTETGSWVRLAMGEVYDMIVDYSFDMEDVMGPVIEYTSRMSDY